MPSNTERDRDNGSGRDEPRRSRRMEEEPRYASDRDVGREERHAPRGREQEEWHPGGGRDAQRTSDERQDWSPYNEERGMRGNQSYGQGQFRGVGQAEGGYDEGGPRGQGSGERGERGYASSERGYGGYDGGYGGGQSGYGSGMERGQHIGGQNMGGQNMGGQGMGRRQGMSGRERFGGMDPGGHAWNLGQSAGHGGGQEHGGGGSRGGYGGGPSGGGQPPANQQQWGGPQGEQRQSFRGRGPVGYQRSDERIKEEVCDRLTDDDHVDASAIEVQVKSGEVILTGTVPDKRSKRLAEDVAENIPGVKDVQNQLRVQIRGEEAESTRSQASSTTSGASGKRKDSPPS